MSLFEFCKPYEIMFSSEVLMAELILELLLSDGYYIYIETSSPRTRNQKARLISPLQPAGTSCLTFYYHMYGANINRLNVYVKTKPQLSSPVFTKIGTQGNQWKQALIDVNPVINYQVLSPILALSGHLS